jgi:uncharacterized protein with PQ loop repeat
MDTIGWIGSLLLAFCGLPQALKCYREKHANGLDWGFLGAWFIGEVMTFAYVLPKMDLPLMANYSANILFLCVILYYKLFPKD